MARHMTETISRLTLIVGLSVIIASCSFGRGPSAMAVAPDITSSRTDYDDSQRSNYTVAVPRVFIDSEQIEADAPDVYTVVRGDTLWDISDRFLKEPWRWSEIWGYNPQVYNPHLIYPGDVLALEYINGQPSLTLTRKGQTIAVDAEPSLGAATPDSDVARAKLSPRIRSSSLADAIPTISSDSVAPFLVHPRVVDDRMIANAPYVIANDEDRLISSIGSKIYVRGSVDRNLTNYSVYRKHKALIDPVDGARLGFELTHVSDAKLLKVGDPSTLGLTRNKMETISGDILLPMQPDAEPQFYTPRLPELRGDARILSLVDAISQTGRNQVVVLNIGGNSSIQEGDVLAVETRGHNLVDKAGKQGWEQVELPNQRTGVLMVFKTYDEVSYALVMESTRPIKVNDIVTGI